MRSFGLLFFIGNGRRDQRWYLSLSGRHDFTYRFRRVYIYLARSLRVARKLRLCMHICKRVYQRGIAEHCAARGAPPEHSSGRVAGVFQSRRKDRLIVRNQYYQRCTENDCTAVRYVQIF
ncbi:hypothetical protein PUN28_002852 [Cardiocondyla obscurior]|uniref:Uncharacterized protein n=1 Tax=Cardiocondyla obscurior TaxID=286306 RepID=A0AAW2GWF0_9HYME